MRYIVSFLACLLFVLCGCDKKSSEYRKAYAQGVSEAQTEISNNTLTLYATGTHPVPVPKDLKDDETGLPIQFIAGCIVNDADMGRQDGHNTTVLEHLKKEIP